LPVDPIATNPDVAFPLRSIEWPVSFGLLSVQERSIWLEEAAVAERDDGATRSAPAAGPARAKRAAARTARLRHTAARLVILPPIADFRRPRAPRRGRFGAPEIELVVFSNFNSTQRSDEGLYSTKVE